MKNLSIFREFPRKCNHTKETLAYTFTVTFMFFVYYINMRVNMGLICKTFALSLIFMFLSIFVSPLFAETLPGEEPKLALEPTPDEQPVPAKEQAFGEEPALTEEPVSDEESLLAGELLYDDDDYDDQLTYEAPPLIFEVSPILEPRSFDDVFPGLSRTQKRMVTGDYGIRNSFDKDGSAMLHPAPDSGIDLLNGYIKKKNPSLISEALILVPYNKRELDMLDIYNALGRIEDIKEQVLYFKDNRELKIFKESTRLESEQNRKPVTDPAPADALPYSETMFIRLTDIYIGEVYIRGEIIMGLYGITYNMTNFRDVYFSIFRVMKAERYSTVIYLEPVKEGILIYSLSAISLPSFIVKKTNLAVNINNRTTIFLSWITDGLREQEDIKDRPTIPFAVN